MRKSSQKSSKMRKKILIVFGAIFLLLIAKFVVGTIKLSPVLWQLIFNKEINLKKADDNINILLLGIGGGKHEGPNLTDSIIFASLDPQKNSVKLISIPRDLWISDIKDKINAAYAIGEDKKKGGGIILTRAIVSKITNQPVDYVIRLDFAGFIKAIDLVGGLDINNENTFDDYEYPIEGKEEDLCGHPLEEIDLLATASSQLEAFPCRYKHIRFDRGLLHIDGQTADRKK
ncbi:MAG: LCP family protein [Candidatus Levybacteria bacterium]|nr:LCP family protein [Candidatus Levybacteria bacterium]